MQNSMMEVPTVSVHKKITLALLDKWKLFFEEAIVASRDSVSMFTILHEVNEDRALFWTIEGGVAKGILVTSFLSQGDHKALFIWLAAGAACAQYAAVIQDALETFACNNSCNEIKAVVSNKKLLKYMQSHLGYHESGTVVFKEIGHERILSKPN